MDNNNPFEQCTNAFTKQCAATSQSDSSVNYMLLRALSMSPEGFYSAAVCNEIANGCPKWALRMLAHTLTPKCNQRRWPYIKKAEVKLTEKDKRIVAVLAATLHLSPTDSIDTYQMLKDKGYNFDAAFGQKIMGAKK